MMAPVAGTVLTLVMWVQESWALSSTTQDQIQGFELGHSNIYPICELLEPVKGQVLQIQSYGVSMTQGNHSVMERSPGEDPVLMMQQKPEAFEPNQ